MRLTPTSDRLTGARRFGLEFRRAVAERGRSLRGLAVETGISRTRMQNWMGGSSLPSVERASFLADLLMWPRLVDLARDARTRACDGCGSAFVVETPTPQRYCSPQCKTFHAKTAGARRDLSRAVLERRARRLTAAVSSMCSTCEPSGVCRTPECPLQLAGVSPVAVAKEAIA